MAKLTYSMIVAMDNNGVIGVNGKLPWPKEPKDLKHFKEVTSGKIVIMGRKTFDSIPEVKNKKGELEKLPGRVKIVLTNKTSLKSRNKYPLYHVSSVEEARAFADLVQTAYDLPKEVMVIGGAQIYEAFKKDIDKAYVTKIGYEMYARPDFEVALLPKGFLNDFEAVQAEEIEGVNGPLTFSVLNKVHGNTDVVREWEKLEQLAEENLQTDAINGQNPFDKKTFNGLAKEVGQLVTEKNAAYGNSFKESGEFLKLLYPNGIKPEQYTDLLCITRIFDKLKRISTDKKAFNEDAWRDICGYALLGLHKDQNEEE